jgi:hypothetical protein
MPSQVIYLDPVLSRYASNTIQTYSSTTLLDLISADAYSINSTFLVGQNSVAPALTIASGVFSNNQFGTTALNLTINPTSVIAINTFGTNVLNLSIKPVSLNSGATFGTTILKLSINLSQDIQISRVQNTPLQAYATTSIQDVSDQFDGLVSTNSFGYTTFGYTFKQTIVPNSITDGTTNSFGVPKLNEKIEDTSILSTVTFGNAQLNQKIDQPTSITTTAVVPNPNVRRSMKPTTIDSTASFGLSELKQYHRTLIFKDDNISKVGPNDAVVVAGGIRINPSGHIAVSANSGPYVMPSGPAGFISININGSNFLMPYFNP